MRMPMCLRLFWAAIKAWWADNVPRLGASLAYYTLFAIGPVLMVAVAIAGSVFGPEAARGQIVDQIEQLIGPDGARAVQGLLAGASQHRGSTLAAVIGVITLVLAAAGAFLELQTALDIIWRVKPRPGINLKAFFLNRLRAFGLVIAIGFLLLVSLAVSAALAGVSSWASHRVPDFPTLLRIANLVLSVGVIAVLFALIYRILPDVQMRWRDVWTGAFVTAILFTVGKELIGLYLGRSTTASAYGAAGSVTVLLLWVYYSAQIVLLGAEFTRVYARRERSKPPPEPFAEKTDTEKVDRSSPRPSSR